MKSLVAAAVSGILFALGLGVSGMTDPAKVVGFLDLTGAWDPSLAFVMGGALVTHAVTRRLVLKRPKPLFASSFPVFDRKSIDGRLVAGSALFGVGWGISGYCPGPAFTSLAGGSGAVFAFVAAMLAGMALLNAMNTLAAARSVPATEPNRRG